MVGQLRGHTLENKMKIYNKISQCGFQFKIVAAFFHMTGVDDKFIKEIIEKGEDVNDLFAFTEAFRKPHDLTSIPHGLKKMKKLNLINPIIDIDVNQNQDVFEV